MDKFVILTGNFLWVFHLLSYFLICVGLWGVCINSQTFIVLLINFELVFLGFVVRICEYSLLLNDSTAQVFCVLILGVLAAETAPFLGLIIKYYKITRIDNILFLKTINLNG